MFHYGPVTVHRSWCEVLVAVPAVLEYQVRQTVAGIDVTAVADPGLDTAALHDELTTGLIAPVYPAPQVTVRVVANLERHPQTSNYGVSSRSRRSTPDRLDSSGAADEHPDRKDAAARLGLSGDHLGTSRWPTDPTAPGAIRRVSHLASPLALANYECSGQRPGHSAGGDEGNRTPNPRLAKAVLCQLSYVPGRIRGTATRPSGRGRARAVVASCHSSRS